MSVIIDVEIDNHSLEEIAEWIVKNEGRCQNCNRLYHKEDIRSYNHDGGFKITGFEKKQWVYMCCPNCEIDMKIAAVISNILIEGLKNEEHVTE